MPSGRHSQRIVIAGASSLLGNEVKSLLEESLFATWDLRLVDEEDVAGTLTEAAGEAAFIQRVDEDTFHGAKYVFLTGSSAFAKQCLAPSREAGATIIDFSRATLSDPDAAPWFPKIAALTGRSVAKSAKAFAVFSVGGIAVASLVLALRPLSLRRLTVVMNRPVSESGREGILVVEPSGRIAEANAAPLTATAASTVRSRQIRGGAASNNFAVSNQPSSGPPT